MRAVDPLSSINAQIVAEKADKRGCRHELLLRVVVIKHNVPQPAPESRYLLQPPGGISGVKTRSKTAAGVNKPAMFSFSEVENGAVLIGG